MDSAEGQVAISLAVEAVPQAQHVHGFRIDAVALGPQAKGAGFYFKFMASAGVVADQDLGAVGNQLTNFI